MELKNLLTFYNCLARKAKKNLEQGHLKASEIYLDFGYKNLSNCTFKLDLFFLSCWTVLVTQYDDSRSAFVLKKQY